MKLRPSVLRLLAHLGVSALCVAAGPGCGSKHVHRLIHTDVPSAALASESAYEVWTPPDWSPEERLPLMVFLHGGGDDEDIFDRARVGQHLDEQVRQGNIPRTVVVVPRGDLGFWENWYDGSRNYRDWVVKEVIPAVQVEYRTLPCPSGCHVGGVSMGGHGTLRFAWFHPEVFASASSLSGPILSTEAVLEFTGRWFVKLFVPVERIWGPTEDRARIESEDLFRQWTRPEDLDGVRLMLAVAKRDRGEIIETNRAFHRHLIEHDIEHAYLEFEGEHKWTSWTPVLDRVLRFAVWGSMDADPHTVSLESPPREVDAHPFEP